MPELLQPFLIFVGLNFLLFSTANTLIWRFWESEVRDVLDWSILFFIIASAEVLMILAGIGFIGHLNLSAMSIATIICYIFGGLRIKSLGKHFQIGTREGWKKLRQLLFRHDKHEGNDWIWAIFGFLVLFGAVELFNAFVQFPWEYDTIAYHMSIVVEWIQSGSLWDVLYAVWGGPLGYYPSNHELMLTWLILPFGNDALANLSNFWIMGILIVVMYKILKELGVRDFLAWLAGALVMIMPIFLRQFGTGQVDVLMALGVLIGWYYCLRAYKRKDGVLLIPLLLNLAIMLGTKYLAIIYIIPILGVFLFLHAYWRKSYRFWWIWALVILGTLGSIWYWRNLIITGNPIFPAEVNIGETVLFAGYSGLTERIQELSLWHRFTREGQLTEWMAAMVGETGWHLFLVTGAYVLLICEMIAKLLFSKMKRGEGKIYTMMLFFLPVYWYLYVITPYTASMMEHNVRYAMPWLMLSMLMVIYVVHKLGTFRKAFVIALMGVLWWQFLIMVGAQRIGEQPFLELMWVQGYPQLFALLLVAIAAFLLFFDSWRKRLWWRHISLILALVLSFGFFQQSLDLREEVRAESWQHKYSFNIMKAHQWLDEHADDDSVIANSLNPLYYPLYGPTLERKVRYININDCGECDYYTYEEKGMTVRDNPSYEAWVQNLSDGEVEYIVLGYSIRIGLEGVKPHELDWVKDHPEQFKRVFKKGDVAIYRFKNLSS